jgi:hypothetical protein
MPEARPIPIAPPPGVVKTEATRVIEGRWSDAQWIRFQAGKPQKRGGHTKQTNALTSGVPRALHAWRDLSQQDYMGAATSKKLYVYDRTFTQADITPIDKTGTLGANPFTTTNGSKIVTVAHTSHTRVSGSAVTFSGATAVGGLTLNGTFTVLVVTGANTYTIQAASAATSGATGGGAAVAYTYEINIGAEAGTYALGYGVGGYGLSTWGTARAVSTLVVEPRIWTLEHYGALLFSSYNGGTIYQFDPATLSTNGRALKLTNAPTDVRAMFITEERFVFALRDNMTINWPDQNDPTIWTPASSNTANTRRLTDGTKLINGLALGQRISLVWSDNALYVFQYTGNASVYDSRKVSTNCGLIAPHAKAADRDGVVYWMSSHTYHLYNGGVSEIPNAADIKDFVFDNLRTDQPYLCWAYYDPKFHEVTFFYVALGASEPELSVTYDIDGQNWTPNIWSAFPRASATKFQHGDTRPYLGGVDGNIYLQEDGYNADGAAIPLSLTLAPFALQDGAQNYELDGIRMDEKGQVGNIDVTVSAYETLRGGVIESETITVTETDELLDPRIAGRYMSLAFSSNAVDAFFRLGKPTAFIKNGGARR